MILNDFFAYLLITIILSLVLVGISIAYTWLIEDDD